MENISVTKEGGQLNGVESVDNQPKYELQIRRNNISKNGSKGSSLYLE